MKYEFDLFVYTVYGSGSLSPRHGTSSRWRYGLQYGG